MYICIYVLRAQAQQKNPKYYAFFWIAVVLGKFRSILEPSTDVKKFRPILEPRIDVKVFRPILEPLFVCDTSSG